MEMTDMAGSPGTPEARRLTRAKDILEGRGMAWQGDGDEAREAQHDARMLQETIETLEFTERETAGIIQKDQAEQINGYRDLVRVAMTGTSAESIGMVIYPKESIPFIITRLHRDPEWVGLNPNLEYCRDLEGAHLRDAGRAGHHWTDRGRRRCRVEPGEPESGGTHRRDRTGHQRDHAVARRDRVHPDTVEANGGRRDEQHGGTGAHPGRRRHPGPAHPRVSPDSRSPSVILRTSRNRRISYQAV